MSKEQVVPEPGRVNKVRNEWLVHEDFALAHNLQTKEFQNKYQFNRSERKTARTDVPLAKYVQSEEEAQLQRERLQMLERQKAIAERDAELAEQFQKLEQEKIKHAAQVLETSDMAIAAQMQQEELIKDKQHRLEVEMKDQEYARMLFEKEYRKYENYLRRRELAKARRRLESEQQREAEKVLAGGTTETDIDQGMRGLGLSGRDEQQSRVVRSDGRVEDLGDFTDFYIPPNQHMTEYEKKQLQELQDEELARLLQDQERKRGAQVNKTALKTLEQRDAELAQIMQEEEKLKSKKHHHHRVKISQSGDTACTEDGRDQSVPADRQNSGYLPSDPNLSNDRVARVASDGSFQDVTPLGSIQGQSPYSQRPLPETPSEAVTERITVVPLSCTDLSPPGSPPPPGYRPPPAYPSPPSHNGPVYSSQSNKRSPGSQNVIAAIDPTFREQGEYRTRGCVIPDQLDDIHLPTRQGHKGTSGAEDGYCDLDELGPIQGQRRSTLQREGQGGSKRNNCKQQ